MLAQPSHLARKYSSRKGISSTETFKQRKQAKAGKKHSTECPSAIEHPLNLSFQAQGLHQRAQEARANVKPTVPSVLSRKHTFLMNCAASSFSTYLSSCIQKIQHHNRKYGILTHATRLNPPLSTANKEESCRCYPHIMACLQDLQDLHQPPTSMLTVKTVATQLLGERSRQNQHVCLSRKLSFRFLQYEIALKQLELYLSGLITSAAKISLCTLRQILGDLFRKALNYM